ncbi:MAG TPA: hypothetical protein DHH36_10270, partial [Afipia sp.]|nr:hypothetical protein [Afipia sp.]
APSGRTSCAETGTKAGGGGQHRPDGGPNPIGCHACGRTAVGGRCGIWIPTPFDESSFGSRFNLCGLDFCSCYVLFAKMNDRPASWHMPTPKQMERLAAEAARKSAGAAPP